MGSVSKYFTALLLVIAASMVGEVLRQHLSPANMVMFFLLAVVIAALWLGQRPAIVTALFGVLAFDLFFVPPRFSFRVADKEYLITFLGLFTVGVVISSLVSKARDRAEELRKREAETAALYRLSRDLAAAPDSNAIYNAIRSNASEVFTTAAALLLPTNEQLQVVSASDGLTLSAQGLDTALWSVNSQRRAGLGTHNHPDSELLCLPLVNMGQCVAALALSSSTTALSDESRLDRIVEGFAVQLRMALVRVELAQQAEQAKILKARETLERALLNSISHDLRTPLATVTGVLSSLKDGSLNLDDQARGELLDTASSEAERLNRFVGNLLEMTRLEAGGIKLNREPCEVQELVGCALAATEQRGADRGVVVNIANTLPLVPMDLVLMTQVLVNLLDNSLKYSPAGSPIEVSAVIKNNGLELQVADRGPGLPVQELSRVFDKFYRIPVPEGAGGTGLGLAICKGIVETHGGNIFAENRSDGGLMVTVRLPLDSGEGGIDGA